MQLADAALCEYLGEDHVDALLREGDGKVEVVSILRHRREIGLQLSELLRELPSPVGPEVEEDRRIVSEVDRPARIDGRRDDELVRDAGVVARVHRIDRTGSGNPAAAHDRSDVHAATGVLAS